MEKCENGKRLNHSLGKGCPGRERDKRGGSYVIRCTPYPAGRASMKNHSTNLARDELRAELEVESRVAKCGLRTGGDFSNAAVAVLDSAGT